jgi:GT2 family glycosyltransferase
VALGERDPARRLRLKPAFDPTLLAATDYVGAPLAVRAEAFQALGGLRADLGEAALYDLLLRADAAGWPVAAVPHVLIGYPGARPEVPVTARRRALDPWAAARGLDVREGRTPETLRLARRFADPPPVTLVVPTRQSGAEGAEPYVVQLLDSLAATDWPMERLSVLVGDDTGRAESFPAGRWPYRLRRVETPRPAAEPFSFAAKMNRLWPLAGTEHLVLLNDDVVASEPGWLEALLTFSTDPGVGAVGARLLYPDGRLQHAGVAGGLFGGAAHPWLGRPADAPTYQDWALVHREWSMVTAAVLATRRSVLEAANGFDERLALEYNDLDLCLRLRLLGYKIVYTPFAELTHREKASRGDAAPAAVETALFHARWREWLADDPAFPPGLARDRFDLAPAEAPDWWA